MKPVIIGKIIKAKFDPENGVGIFFIGEHSGVFKPTGKISVTMDVQAIKDFESHLGYPISGKGANSLIGKVVEIVIQR